MLFFSLLTYYIQARDLKRAQSEALMNLKQEQYKDELDLYSKYHEPLYEALEQVRLEKYNYNFFKISLDLQISSIFHNFDRKR